jgi:hypothetical protein
MQDSLTAAGCYKIGSMSEGAHLVTWVTRKQKERFCSLASHQGMCESALLRRLVEIALQGATIPEPVGLNAQRASPRGARLYVRLRLEDQLLLGERASARGLRAATYVSVLIRAHLRHLPPLPKEELVALKRAVAELGAIGRNLNQIATVSNQHGRVLSPSRDDLQAFLRVCTALRDNVKRVIKGNVISWETGHAKNEA